MSSAAPASISLLFAGGKVMLLFIFQFSIKIVVVVVVVMLFDMKLNVLQGLLT